MHRAPAQKLRGLDPTMLEIQILDLLNRPTSQLDPANLCDIYALAELEKPPKPIVRRLEKFIERSRQELADIPDGAPMNSFVADLAKVDPSRVPQTLRDHMGELGQREGRDNKAIRRWIEQLDAVPEPFELAEPKVRPPASTSAPTRGRMRPRTGRSSSSSSRSSSSPQPARQVVAALEQDPEKHEFLCQLVLDRLRSSNSNELGETVLIAGVRHRARKRYPQALPQEVSAALRDLLDRGLVRKSAGRWSAARR